MNYCGLDLGKKSSHFCIVDENRHVVREGKLSNRPSSLEKVFGKLKPMRIVLEASCKSFWMADQLETLGHRPVVVDPGQTKAVGATLIKHDRLDARVLATLNAADLLAVVSRPRQAERLARMPVVVRDGLVQCRAKLVNTVRSLLDSEGFVVKDCAVGAFTGLVCAAFEDYPEDLAAALTPLLESIDALSLQISYCEEAIAEALRSDATAQLLMTTPGVKSVVVSHYIMAVRDPARFKSGRQVGAYLGLVPSLYESGTIRRRGRITKRGHAKARWALTMAANAVLRTKQPSHLRDWGLALAERVGRQKAVVALARKLASVLWSMWKHRRPYEPMYSRAA